MSQRPILDPSLISAVKVLVNGHDKSGNFLTGFLVTGHLDIFLVHVGWYKIVVVPWPRHVKQKTTVRGTRLDLSEDMG